jgi:hypothetical protein
MGFMMMIYVYDIMLVRLFPIFHMFERVMTLTSST